MVLVFVFALNPWSAGEMEAAKKNGGPAVQYKRQVYLGIGSFKYPEGVGNCIDLGSLLSSGDFFEGISLTDTQAGPQFYKQGQLVEVFPENLLIEVSAVTDPTGCDYAQGTAKQGANPPPILLGPGPPIDLEKSVHFEIAFVKGSLAVPAQVISTRAGKMPFTEAGPQRWGFDILVRSKGERLTDEVKLKVLSEDGKLLTCIAGGLLSPVNRRIYKAGKHRH